MGRNQEQTQRWERLRSDLGRLFGLLLRGRGAKTTEEGELFYRSGAAAAVAFVFWCLGFVGRHDRCLGLAKVSLLAFGLFEEMVALERCFARVFRKMICFPSGFEDNPTFAWVRGFTNKGLIFFPVVLTCSNHLKTHEKPLFCEYLLGTYVYLHDSFSSLLFSTSLEDKKS